MIHEFCHLKAGQCRPPGYPAAVKALSIVLFLASSSLQQAKAQLSRPTRPGLQMLTLQPLDLAEGEHNHLAGSTATISDDMPAVRGCLLIICVTFLFLGFRFIWCDGWFNAVY